MARSFLSSAAIGTASKTGLNLQIEGLGGLLPFSIRLSRITLVEEDTPWLSAENISLDWSFALLPRPTIRVKHITADRLRLDRLPPTKEMEDKPPFRLSPDLILGPAGHIPSMAIAALEVSDLVLGEALLGHEVHLRVQGNASSLAHVLQAELSVTSPAIDEGVEATARLGLDAAGESVSLVLDYKEKNVDLLRGAAKLPLAEPFTLVISGGGPLKALPFTLRAEYGQDASLDLGGQMDWAEELSVRATGQTVVPDRYLPEKLRAMENKGVALDLRTKIPSTFGAGQKISVAGEVKGLETVAKLDASFAPFDKSLQGTVFATVDDVAPFGVLLDRSVTGRIALDLAVKGNEEGMAFQMGTNLQDLSFDAFSLVQGDLHADINIQPPYNDQPPNASFELSGKFAGGSAPQTGAIEGDFLSITAKGLSGPERGVDAEYTLSSAAFALDLEGNGQWTSADDSIHSRGTLVASDLAKLAVFTKQETAGRAELHLDVRSNIERAEHVLTIDGQAESLRVWKDSLDVVFGPYVKVQAAMRMGPGKLVQLDRLDLSNESFSSAISGTYKLDDQNADLSLDFSSPDLAVFSALAGQDLAGKAHLTAQLSGPLREAALSAKAEASNLLLNGRRFNALDAQLAISNLSNPAGSAALMLSDASHSLNAKAGFAFQKDQLRLDDLEVTGPGFDAEGDFLLESGGKPQEGTLAIHATDLSRIGTFLNLPLRGELHIDGRVEPRSGVPVLFAAIDGRGLAYGDYRVEALSADADLSDPFEAWNVQSEGKLDRATSGTASIGHAEWRFSGDASSGDFMFKVSGKTDQPFDAHGRGMYTGEAPRVDIRLEEFSGAYAGQPVVLEGGLEASYAPEAMSIDPAVLSIGDSKLRLSAKRQKESVEASMDWKEAPLSILALVGAPEMAGFFSSDVQVSGAANDPVITAKLGVAGALLPDSPAAELPLDAKLELWLSQGKLEAQVSMMGISEDPSSMEVRVPVTLSFEPLTLELAASAPLQGNVDLNADLKRFAQAFLPPAHRVLGILRANGSFQGTVGNPTLSGGLSLAGGRYENLETGTLLSDVQLDTRLDKEKLFIDSLRAKDGELGEIALTGTVDWSKGLQAELHSDLNTMELLRTDMAYATAGGALEVTATSSGAQVQGELSLSPVDIEIPRGGGPDVATIEVTEAGSDEDTLNENKGAKPVKQKFPIGLDVAVQIPGRFFVRGRGLDSEWQGRLAVTGDASQPIIKGTLSVLRGSFDFLNKRWRLGNCTITLDGSSPPDPLVDFTATVDLSDIVGKLRIAGPISAPGISLESEPPLPQDAILAQVLFGRPIGEITPGQAVQLAAAGRKLSGAGGNAFDMVSGLRRSLGFDALRIDTGLDDFQNSSVGIGKYITDKIYMEATQGLATEETNVSVEFQFGPQWTLLGESSTSSSNRIVLRYRRDY